MKKVKVKDIAQAAGVSPSAVSLVLNHKPSRLSEATKEKILRVAREMEFQSEYAVETQAYKRVYTLGLVLPTLTDPFYNEIAIHVQQYANAKDYIVFLCMDDDDVSRCCSTIESLAMKNVDGLILVSPSADDKEERLAKMLKALQNSNFPMVLLDRVVYSVFCDFVTTDNKYGGKAATQYLVERGHRKIGCLTGPEKLYTARKRMQGYREGLASVKIPFSEQLVYRSELSKEDGAKGAEILYDQGCTAIFAANNLLTEGAIEFAEQHHLQMPDELEVVGYDAKSRVTSICQNTMLMAEKSVDLVLEQIRLGTKEIPPRNFYITPTLEAASGLGLRDWEEAR